MKGTKRVLPFVVSCHETFRSVFKSLAICTGSVMKYPLLGIAVTVAVCSAAIAAMPLPVGQNFYQYAPVTSPVISADPSSAKPIGVGTADQLSLLVEAGQFTGAVDLYLAIYVPALDSQNVYLFTESGLRTAAQGIAPWKTGVISVNADVFGQIQVSSLPQGDYSFYLLATPAGAGNVDNYYLWGTTAVIPPGIFQVPANPINVTPAPDQTRTVTAVIGTGGGTIAAAAADGSAFSLAIPPGALSADTTITMTPVTSIQGLPLSGGLAAAVELGPEGLFLRAPATLTIVPSSSIPLEEQTFFGYLGSGQNFHGEPPVIDTSAFQIRIFHFSGYGVGSGTVAARNAILNRAADNAKARLAQHISALNTEERQARQKGAGDPNYATKLRSLLEMFKAQVLDPRARAAIEDCDAVPTAVSDELLYIEMLYDLGLHEEPGQETIRLWSLRDTWLSSCIQKASTDCVNKHLWLRMGRIAKPISETIHMMQTSSDTIIVNEYKTKFVKCAQFTVFLDSEASQTAAGTSGWTFTEAVTGDAHIEATFEGNSATFKGTGVTKPYFYDIKYHDPCTTVSGSVFGGGSFDVEKLRFVFAGSVLTDFVVYYYPGQTPAAHVATDNCSQPIESTVKDFPTWWVVYIVAMGSNADYFSATDGFFLKGWKIEPEGSNLVASKEFKVTFSEDEIEYSASNKLKLFHIPIPDP